MTETKKTEPKPKPGRPRKPHWERMMELAKGLSAHDHKELEERGWLVPWLADAKGDMDTPTWIYLCVHCGEPALHFVGEKFRGHDGQLCDRPPVSLTIDELPWVQPAHQAVNRYAPVCQHCGQEVARIGRYFKAKHIYHAEQWAVSRKDGMEKLREHRAKNPGQVEGRIQVGGNSPVTSGEFGDLAGEVSDYIPEDAKAKIVTLENAYGTLTPGTK